MIKQFEVENFKGFKDTLVMDFTAREYAFNKNLVKDGIVNKAIVYGKNGVGKSGLGIALFDIIRHLTDKEKMPNQYLANYINLDSDLPYARFKYVFQFDDDIVIYEYQKKNPDYLLQEKLWINDTLVIDFNYFDKNQQFVEKSLAGDLRIELLDNTLSITKYIYRNTPIKADSPFTKMMQFCDNMLWYRGLSDGNTYCGFTNGGALLIEKLYESGKIRDFEEFLKSNSLDYKLKFITVNGIHVLMAVYDKSGEEKETPFLSVASTGTMALFLFYIWSISAFTKISFLFIDEFDAFFHYESAENIVLRLNKAKSFQSILTSHNTYLMQNKLTRPDCCFIMTNNKITSLFNSTEKEIREAHNLEKMYINGAFNE
ncbi:MAG: ATP-binding protein [Treponema sp.]|nr:ATP-binding protein [Treponema sp.]